MQFLQLTARPRLHGGVSLASPRRSHDHGQARVHARPDCLHLHGRKADRVLSRPEQAVRHVVRLLAWEAKPLAYTLDTGPCWAGCTPKRSLLAHASWIYYLRFAGVHATLTHKFVAEGRSCGLLELRVLAPPVPLTASNFNLKGLFKSSGTSISSASGKDS